MTNAEKHQKIYELTGIEPGYWRRAEHPDRKNTIVLLDKYTAQKEIGGVIESIAHPHYSAEQLWDLLPAIKDYCLRMNKAIIYYEHWADSRHEVPDLIEFSIVNSNLLTALLDMVLWCISEGYIKKRGEE